MSKKKRKVRTDFRKNREVRARDKRVSRRLARTTIRSRPTRRTASASAAKGDISRKRTVAGGEIVEDEAGTLDAARRRPRRLPPGPRAARARLASASCATTAGAMFQCATRRLLKTLATDQRHVVAAGDVVWFRPEGEAKAIIERVEPRHGVVSRTSRGRQHVLVANVDQLVIVTSAAEPRLKPNLIDRLLVTAEKGGIRPIICINKIDLIEPADLMPLVGVYASWATTCCWCRRRRDSASIGCASGSPAPRASSPAKAASASRRCFNAVEPGSNCACRR